MFFTALFRYSLFAIALLGSASLPAEEIVTHAEAVLHPTNGSSVKGVVTFTQKLGGIQVIADIQGLKPGNHGFHIHEFGDCSSPDASSAGAHLNPTKVPHGAPDSDLHHEGDLGNILADENGDAHYEYTWGFLSLNGPYSIIGKSVIVHEKADDLKSQPAGDAGGRQACGVIKASRLK